MLANKLNSESGLSEAKQDASSAPGIVRWVTRVLGCWHKDMSRPFSSQGQTYRVCVRCGARRPFNLASWEMQGDFYYSVPTRKHSSPLGRPTAPESSQTSVKSLAQFADSRDL